MTDHYDERMFQDLAHGSLSAEERERLREHMAVCPSCMRHARETQVVERLLRSMPLEQADPHLADRVLARVARTEQRALWAGAMRPAVAGAILGVLIVLGVIIVMLWQLPAVSGASTVGQYADRWMEDLVGFTRVGSSRLMQLVPQLLGPGPVRISGAVVLLVPLLLIVDRFLTRRRVIG